tara:strand:- start:725 stop:1894 length:1170 start_codon:yes stop_codon:yes gene_type:complete
MEITKLYSNTTKLVRQPYLQNAFKDSISILWVTNSGSNALVRYGKNKPLNEIKKGHIFQEGIIFRNQVTIKDLEPDTKYFYEILTDNKLLTSGDSYTFQTESNNGKNDFRFYAMGDIGEPMKTGGFPIITSYQIANLKKQPNFGIGLGDIIYPDGESKYADEYLFKPMESILRNIPFYPALGNHDWHINPDLNFTKEWKLPNNEHYYSFNYNNAHFIALDTRDGNLYDKENQLKWFENSLKAAQGQYDWIFVYFHHNGRTCTYKSEYEDIIQLYPYFVRYNVDLVFNGHAHTYERLRPLDANGYAIKRFDQKQNSFEEIKDGFIQITTGAGGKLRKNWQPDPNNCDKKIVAAVAHTGHFTLVDIKNKELKLKAIASIGGAVLDSLMIKK